MYPLLNKMLQKSKTRYSIVLVIILYHINTNNR